MRTLRLRGCECACYSPQCFFGDSFSGRKALRPHTLRETFYFVVSSTHTCNMRFKSDSPSTTSTGHFPAPPSGAVRLTDLKRLWSAEPRRVASHHYCAYGTLRSTVTVTCCAGLCFLGPGLPRGKQCYPRFGLSECDSVARHVGGGV